MSTGFARGLNPDILLPAAKVLLIGAFVLTLIQALKDSEELSAAFERFAIAFFSLLFFQGALSTLSILGGELSEFISKQGDPQSLKQTVLQTLSAASSAPTSAGAKPGLNLPAFLEQAWRLGVWGILSQIVDFFFVLSSFLIETARSVFWQILVFLFPLGCAVYPIFPGIFKNLWLYAVEICLWDSVLRLIQITTGFAAKAYLTQEGSLGLPIVAVELIAIVLTLSIPAITHRIVGGALNSDMGGSTLSALQISRNWMGRMKGGVRS